VAWGMLTWKENVVAAIPSAMQRRQAAARVALAARALRGIGVAEVSSMATPLGKN
jgi:hypothetical protein